MLTVQGRHHDANAPVDVILDYARGLDLGVMRGTMTPDSLKLYDPPRHSTDEFLKLVAKMRSGWPKTMPAVWVAVDEQGNHLHDGHHRAMAAQIAGLKSIPAVFYNRAAFRDVERRFGISRTGYIFDVLAELDPIAAANARKGTHREAPVVGSNYRQAEDVVRTRERVIRLADDFAWMCERVVPESEMADAPLTMPAVIQRFRGEDPENRILLRLVLRNALIVALPQLRQRFPTADWHTIHPAVMRVGGPFGGQPVTALSDWSSKNDDALRPVAMTSLALNTDPSETVTQSYRFTQGSSNKRWSFVVYGPLAVRAWGRVGHAPQTMGEFFGSKEEAVEAMMNLAGSKQAKGYTRDAAWERELNLWRPLTSQALGWLDHYMPVDRDAGFRLLWRLTMCSVPFTGGLTEYLR